MMYVPFCLRGSSRCHIKQSNRSMVNGINGKRQCLFPFGYEAKSTCPLDGKVNMARNPVMFTALKFSLKISMPFRDSFLFSVFAIAPSFGQLWNMVNYAEKYRFYAAGLVGHGVPSPGWQAAFIFTSSSHGSSLGCWDTQVEIQQ